MKRAFLKLCVCLLLPTVPAQIAPQQSFATQIRTEKCPAIEIVYPYEIVPPDSLSTFSVTISGGDPSLKPSFNWTTSSGIITSGQGTPAITVQHQGDHPACLTVTVEVGGVSADCPKTAVRTLPVICCVDPRRFDEYGNIAFREEKERLDNLAYQAKTESNTQIRIMMSAAPGQERLALKRARRARNYLIKQHGFEGNSILIEKGYESALTLAFYITPRDLSHIINCKKS